jgi:hypothetical protein
MQIENEETQGRKKKVKKKSSSKSRVLISVIGVVVVVLMATFFVYNSAPTGFLVRFVTAVIPYPVMSIDGTSVSFKDYLSEYDSLVKYFESNEDSEEEVPSEIDSREMILKTITNKVIIQKLAKKHGVKVDQTKVEEFYVGVVAGEESEEVFEKQIKETFGWSTKEFKKRIVESIVLAGQMNEFIQTNEEMQKSKKDLALESFARIASGEDFGAVAKEVHNKVKVLMDSDLGFLKLSDIPETWRESVGELKIGEFTNVLELPEGYAMFMAVDRAVSGDDVQIHLLTLTIPKKSLEEVSGEYLNEIEVKRYLK